MNHLCPRGIELDKAAAEAYRAWWVESRKPNPKPLLKHHRETAKNNAKNALVTHLNCCAACKRVMEEIA